MKPLSLKMRAIGLLSQREHSLSEMRRKLLRISHDMARAQAREGAVAGDAPADEVEEADAQQSSASAEIEMLLDWLQAQGYLSEARFVESRVHARAQRYGNLRIKQELAQHGLSLDADAQETLKASELARARAVWQRKFGGHVPEDQAARARQARFLVARGFASEVVRRVLRAEQN